MPELRRFSALCFFLCTLALSLFCASAQGATAKSNTIGSAKAEAALAFNPFDLKASSPSAASPSYVLVSSISAAATGAAPASPLNPSQVWFSINDVTVNLPTTGGSTAKFTVTLSAPCNQSLSIYYSTLDGTAKRSVDYVATSGKLTFAAGVQSQTFNVTVLNNKPAKTLTFSALLSGSSGGSKISRATGNASIVPAAVNRPQLTLYGVSTNIGTAYHVVYAKVTLSAPLKQAVTFTFNTTAGSVSPRAEANGVDYIAVPPKQITLLAGQTSISIPISITGGSKLPRTTPKPAKGSSIYFGLQISNVSSNATIKTGTATVTILYDK